MLADVNLMEKLKHEYDRLGDTFPQRENRNFATENCSGNNLAYCANVFSSFDVTNSKDCKYVGWMFDSKDCYDVYDW